MSLSPPRCNEALHPKGHCAPQPPRCNAALRPFNTPCCKALRRSFLNTPRWKGALRPSHPLASFHQ